MRGLTVMCVLLIVMLSVAPAPASAQSLTITPASPYVGLNKTLQFSVQATGLSSSDVIWRAGRVVGGTSRAGTIAAAGRYTAPGTLPSQNPVKITATSRANPTVSATIYVNIVAPGPVITSVAPNPLPQGTFTLAIQGTGFKPGATIMSNCGTSGNVQLTTASLTPTLITAKMWQGAGTTATFTVKNPGPEYSNAITVPIAGGTSGTKYALSVVNGSGSGAYTAGSTVTVTANAPGPGQTFTGWTGATVQNPAAATTTLTMPAAAATVTANYSGGVPTYALTVTNGSGSGSYAAGAVVPIIANAAPAGQQFANWSGAAVQNALAASTTITMPAAAASVAANYNSIAVDIPYPVSAHPRLWVTVSDLPRLRQWANGATNPIYQQGMLPLLQHAVDVYNTQFFPNGVQNPNYPDPGDTQGYQGSLTEQYGVVLAFNSLIDPNPANRIQYAQYARNLLMVAMNQAALGHLAGAPFRDPKFAVYNRANCNGEQWPLIVDWIYNAVDGNGSPILSQSDKLTIRNVFLMWANDCINASTAYGDHPSPIGVTNSWSLLPKQAAYRMAANNYYLGHARQLTMMALVMDPADDPVVNSAQPASQLGNSMRSYVLNATGAWLYQEFAMFGDPSAVANAYGLPGTAGLGMSSGGLPPEGMLYGHSFGFLFGQLLALQTAGFNNQAVSGPQIQLIGAPVWDRFVTGFIGSLTPSAKVYPGSSYLGPVYEFASYGDLLRRWVTPEYVQPFALLSLLEQQNGKTTNYDAARWFAVNAVEGGSAALMTHVKNPWSWSPTQSILYYLLMDPAAPAAADPRPGMPTLFYDQPAGRILARSDWSPTGTLFDYRASWESICHQDCDAGQFELYRSGEWLTKEMSNYDGDCMGMTTVYHNTLALQNWCANGTPKNLQWNQNGMWNNGSQWNMSLSAGDPTTVTSSGPGYVYASSDLTKLYNRPNSWTAGDNATDITQATRSIVWLNNDYIVVYDRATSQHAGLFKRFNLSLVNNPAISADGATTVESMASGQNLFIQTVLPANPTTSAANLASGLRPVAQLEPTRYVLTVQDAANPADTRFLHVLQGADPGTSMDVAARVSSTGGTPFDGTAFGSTAVYFPVAADSAFTATSFPAPAGVHTMLITGLAANTAYSVSVQSTGLGFTVAVAPGGMGGTTDAAGVLSVTF